MKCFISFPPLPLLGEARQGTGPDSDEDGLSCGTDLLLANLVTGLNMTWLNTGYMGSWPAGMILVTGRRKPNGHLVTGKKYTEERRIRHIDALFRMYMQTYISRV
ncbi:hypothetical protein DQX05_26660 [Paenibacillus thiaminolyticus]|uniref:Uncharacterized protein n=1 Tax=Paenibacillus thiaminolyticus TaxID=49283 RepID=A0A3A3GCD6_PANTH|nr:hypothetical protein DQX05_26660 [Paenibacillus thiaminolyticus]